MASGFNPPYPVPPVSYNPMQQQQQQQQQQVAMGMSQPQQNIQVSPSAGSIGQNPGLQQQQQSMLPTKEPNYAVLCRAGQEYVHDIVNKTNELFQLLKVTQLPNGLTQQATMPTFKERKAKAADLLEAITVLFRKLRVLYDHIVEYTSTLEKPPINSLLPFEGTEVDERGKNTEIYRFVSDEHKEVQEQVRQKNQQIKEVMCQMRNLIWEINTMISMRKL